VGGEKDKSVVGIRTGMPGRKREEVAALYIFRKVREAG